jgi:hypothetical protein
MYKALEFQPQHCNKRKGEMKRKRQMTDRQTRERVGKLEGRSVDRWLP